MREVLEVVLPHTLSDLEQTLGKAPASYDTGSQRRYRLLFQLHSTYNPDTTWSYQVGSEQSRLRKLLLACPTSVLLV